MTLPAAPPTPPAGYPPQRVRYPATAVSTTSGVETLRRQLGVRHAAAILPAWLERAVRHEVGSTEFLQGGLEEEVTAQAAAETQRRLRQAGFPVAASIEQFDFRFRPELKRQLVLRERDPTFVAQGQSLTVIGAPGLGKTLVAIAVATNHVQLGATARFRTAQRLAVPLGRAATPLGRQRVLQPRLRGDVLGRG